jgi:phosphohistidine phosphatase SixA
LTRAKATLEIVAKELKVPGRARSTKHLAPEGGFRQLIGLLSRLPAGAKHVLLVGHEPHLSHVVGMLVAGGKVNGFRLNRLLNNVRF